MNNENATTATEPLVVLYLQKNTYGTFFKVSCAKVKMYCTFQVQVNSDMQKLQLLPYRIYNFR
jgi:hypothetical protein